MPNIIHIETSTSVCSAALSSDGVVQCHFGNFEGPSHASLLGVYVKQIMDFSRDKGVKVDAVAVSSGPGSYTGLRIGVSEAKGLCFGLKVPLISVPTLELLACTTMFVEGIVPLATDMLALAERAFRNGQFEDVAYFEPFYLKEFIATTPKNKIS